MNIKNIISLWLYGGIHEKTFGLYRLLSKRFPYGIYYDLQQNTVIVVAVLDLRQNPKHINFFINERI